jgi:hypothetical protein
MGGLRRNDPARCCARAARSATGQPEGGCAGRWCRSHRAIGAPTSDRRETRAGTVEPKIPEPCKDSYLPGFLEPRGPPGRRFRPSFGRPSCKKNDPLGRRAGQGNGATGMPSGMSRPTRALQPADCGLDPPALPIAAAVVADRCLVVAAAGDHRRGAGGSEIRAQAVGVVGLVDDQPAEWPGLGDRLRCAVADERNQARMRRRAARSRRLPVRPGSAGGRRRRR